MLRISTGIIAFFLLLFGGGLYVFQPEVNPVVPGMMVRIGALFGVIWLAFPQLQSLKGRIPTILIALAMISIAIAAAKPKLGGIVITIVTIGVAVGGVLRWLSRVADNAPKRPSK
jgi:hypothetical protein